MANSNGVSFEELAKAKIKDKRNLVISSCSKGGYTIAQQIEVEEGKRLTSVFMSGAIQVDDLHGLYNLRDALNVAIDREERATKEDKAGGDWD